MPKHLTPFDPIGPLQLRIMNHQWTVKVATVQEVGDALNGQPGVPQMAYTTFLTVLRNLAKRRILDQRKIAGSKRHQFVALVDEESFKSGVVRQILETYCDGDVARFWRYCREEPAPAAS